MFDYLGARDAGEAPRSITMVLDKGLGLHGLEDLLSAAGSYVQIIKFGWDTSMVLDRDLLTAKIERIRARGIQVCPGGTFLEIAYVKNAIPRFLADLKSLGFSCVEVSNGTFEIPIEAKVDLIKRACDEGFTVVSEIGKKTAEEDERLDALERAELTRRELEAGAWKVIVEARESGSLGIFDARGEVKASFVEDFVDRVDLADIVFEAPNKNQQVWLMKRFGADVHLGNVKPEDAISVETMRRGLRADTVKDFLLQGVQVRLALGVSGSVEAARRGDVVVIVDSLRASSTIVTALAAGMAAVVPTSSIDDCLGDGKISAGERGGRKIPGFDHGNSPLEIRRQSYSGRTLHLSTTNGTECILNAGRGAAAVLIGCLLNARAVARAAYELARRDGRNITLLAAGRHHREAIEDTISATEIAHHLPECPLVGTISPVYSSDFVADFISSDTGKNLIGLGYGADVELCAQKDLYDIVPILSAGRLVVWPGLG